MPYKQICALSLFLVAVYIIASPHLFKAQLRQRGDASQTPADFGLEFETVRFPARGSTLEIAAWWLPADDRKRVVLLVHGGASNKSMPWIRGLALARDLVDEGYSVLMPDMRNHGDSDGSARVAFGEDEAADVLGAVDFIVSKDPETRFAAIGFSMGGSAVLHAAALEPRIEAVVAVAVSNDFFGPVVRSVKAAAGLPEVLAIPLLISGELQGLLAIPRSVASVIGRIGKRPILLIQNEADLIVPPDHLDALAAALPGASVWMSSRPPPDHPIWKQANGFGLHVRSYTLYPVEFMERVTLVLEAAFGRVAEVGGE